MLEMYKPYDKQIEFHNNSNRERLFLAGNQLGKTVSGAAEVAYHLTGLYPDWWKGRRFKGVTKGWCAGESGESTRDNPQRLLMGEIGELGMGMIPKELLGNISMARGVSNLMDHVLVKHVSGGWSHLFFKSYGKGREKWQGATLDWLWFDEEPPFEVYSEGMTRTNTKLGPVFVTFTPLKGVSDVVHRYLNEESANRGVITMTIDDVGHYTADEKEQIISTYPEHEREARSKGLPMMGSGKVFTVTEESITADVQIQPWWFRICGIDFGSDHPFSAVWLAWDKDTDIVYVYDTYKERRATPVIHSAAIKARGDLPIAWPLDGLQVEKGSGRALKKLYQDQGLNMLSKPARYGDQRGNFVEPGIADLMDRMMTGRFKVASGLKDWWEEFRMYHRKDGKVVKVRDDLLDATRYGLMSLRYATQHSVQERKRDMWDDDEERAVNWKTA